MPTFEVLNDKIVYTEVSSRGEALKLKEDAINTAASGKSVVIFFDNRYHLNLAPGHDPYQIRNDIESWQSKKDSADISTAATTNQPVKTKSSRPRPSFR